LIPTQPDPRFPYGTRPKQDAPDQIYVASSVIREILGPWAEPYARAIPYVGDMAFETFSYCSTPPEDADWGRILRDSLLTFGPFGGVALGSAVIRWTRAVLWPEYCEAKPAPSPDLPPPPATETPVLAPPPADLLPVPPPETPEGPDLGAQLSAQMQMLRDLAHAVQWLRDNVTVRQYSFGAEFGIEGTGTKSHLAAVGYIIEANYPEQIGRTQGADPRYFDAGFISCGHLRFSTASVEGGFPMPVFEPDLGPNIRLSRKRQFLWNAGPQTDLFGWELRPGVSATVTALHVVPLEDSE
jgi:hypothetical protein